MKIKWEVLFESMKEPLRLIALAVVSWLLVEIVPQMDEKWIPIFTIILKWIDKFIHEYRKESGTEGTYKGITGF